MGQIYKITNIVNKKLYIGVAFGKESTYLTRFEKHMEGKGGVWIARDLQAGLFTRDDFITEVIDEIEEITDADRDKLLKRETYYIKVNNSLYPNGYNGNIGNAIVNTPETIKKGLETRRKHIEDGTITFDNISRLMKGKATYRLPDQKKLVQLPTTHPLVLAGIAVHHNYNPRAKFRRKALAKEMEKMKNGGITDKDKSHRLAMKSVHLTSWWKKGRDTFRARMARKEFTKLELLNHKNLSVITAEQWEDITYSDRLIIVTPGLNVMNETVLCEHCGKETNKGNYKRWHGDNCKPRKPWKPSMKSGKHRIRASQAREMERLAQANISSPQVEITVSTPAPAEGSQILQME
jgi:hypothetical protein